MGNWRFNPFTGELEGRALTEFHRIGILSEVPKSVGEFYGIRTNEGVFDRATPYVTIEHIRDATDRSNVLSTDIISTFTEVPRGQEPENGFYRIDYDSTAADVNLNTGIIQFNEVDRNKLIRLQYDGTGTILKEGLALEPPGSFRWHFPNYEGAWSVDQMRAVGWAVMDGTTSASQVNNPTINATLPDMMPVLGADNADDHGFFIKAAKKPADGVTYDNDWATADNNIGVLQDWAQFDLSSMSGDHHHETWLSETTGSVDTRTISHIRGTGNRTNGNDDRDPYALTSRGPNRNIFSWPAGIHWATTTFPRNYTAVPFLKVR